MHFLIRLIEKGEDTHVVLVNFSENIPVLLNEKPLTKVNDPIRLTDGDIFGIFDLRWRWISCTVENFQKREIQTYSNQIKIMQSQIDNLLKQQSAQSLSSQQSQSQPRSQSAHSFSSQQSQHSQERSVEEMNLKRQVDCYKRMVELYEQDLSDMSNGERTSQQLQNRLVSNLSQCKNIIENLNLELSILRESEKLSQTYVSNLEKKVPKEKNILNTKFTCHKCQKIATQHQQLCESDKTIVEQLRKIQSLSQQLENLQSEQSKRISPVEKQNLVDTIDTLQTQLNAQLQRYSNSEKDWKMRLSDLEQNLNLANTRISQLISQNQLNLE